MLRVLTVMQHHLPRPIPLFCAPTQSGCSAFNWSSSPQYRTLVQNEIRLLGWLDSQGYSIPFASEQPG
jgi:hypothetical protein